MPAMTDQLTNQILQALFTIGVAALAYFARKAWGVLKDAHGKMVHLDECIDTIRVRFDKAEEQLGKHVIEAQQRDREIAGIKQEHTEEQRRRDGENAKLQVELAFIKGILGVAIDTPVQEIRKPEPPPVLEESA